MNECSQSELEKEVEDVKLLQESLVYQEDDPSQQQQALRALGEILCQNRRAQDYFCSTRGLEYVLYLSKTTKSPALSQAALYTLSVATEGNDISQRALTKKSVFHSLRSNIQAKNSSTSTRTVFLLLTICAANAEGQNLARETKCLHCLCDLFKSCLPLYKMPSSIDTSDEKWKAVVAALQSLLQNPRNAENQRICCRLLPMIVNILQLAIKQRNIILPTTTLMGAIVCGNGECQSKVRLLGGLRALINVLKQHISDQQPTEEDLNFIEHVVNTIGSATAGHEMCQETTADLGLVSLLVRCLEMSPSPGLGAAGARQFRTKCILALSICVDQCERNQKQLRQRGGVGLLVELLTQEQSEEFRRVAIFVLHCIIGKHQGERPVHEFEELQLEFHSRVHKQDVFIQAASCSREAATQTDAVGTRTVSSGQSNMCIETVSPTRDAKTQTERSGTEEVSTEQSNRFCQVCVPTREAIKERSQDTRKATQQRRRFISTKVLKPQSKLWNSQSRDVRKKSVRNNSATTTRPAPCSAANQCHMQCGACESVLNSKNFLSTLRCSRLCSYHRELNAFLRRKLKGLRGR